MARAPFFRPDFPFVVLSVYYGDKLTIVRNPKDELKTGTLHAILTQLGLTLREL